MVYHADMLGFFVLERFPGTVMTLLLASMLLREPLSQSRVIGVLVMLLGLSLVLRSPSGPRPT